MRLTRSLVVLTATALVGGSAVAATAAPRAGAFDYTKVPGLSAPSFADVKTTSLTVKATDGVDLYIEVTKPTKAGRYPVVLEASPYHGPLADRRGTRILPDPRDGSGASLGLTGFFAPRGYAVVMMDLRGTGRSRGCLDHLGPLDGKDLKTVVEWAAAQPWSNGRVGMTGHSYVGSTPMVAAAQKPKGLRTIVPSAGLAGMYDHQFQGGVPYNLQYAGPQYAYEGIAIARKLPPGVPVKQFGESGDDFGNNMQDTGCGLPSSAALAGPSQVTGQYDPWHAARDWSKGATASKIPAFLVHGVNDNAARIPAADWFMDRGGRKGDKAWIGQWDHGSGFAPTRRGIQWPFALLAWFDKQLKGKAINTGPATEVFLNDASTVREAIRDNAEREVLVADRYPVAKASLSLHATASGSLAAASGPDGTRAFAGDPFGQGDFNLDKLDYTSAPLTRDVVLAGLPELRLSAAVTGQNVALIANVFDKDPGGQLRRITQFAINPLLRQSLKAPAPVVPGQQMTLNPPGWAMGHRLQAGHSLVLRIATSDPDKVATQGTDARVTVHSGRQGTLLRLPVVSAPKLRPDTVRTTG